MGLYFRKSISLGHGIRMNFSKSGIGLSTGVKGFRVSTGPSGTRATASIPGTGIYYTKRLSSTPRSSRSSRYQYQQAVRNPYTGRERVVRANTSWELQSLVDAETARQQVEEIRIRDTEQRQSLREQAAEMTRQEIQRRESIARIISQTLKIDDKLDWDKQYHREPFRSKINGEDFSKYIEGKNKYEFEQRKHNADIRFLKENFEDDERTAIEKYVSIILSNSQYPPDIDLDFDVSFKKGGKLTVGCLLPLPENLPLIQEYRYVASRNEIDTKPMPDKEIRSLLERTYLAIAIRTLHELYEAIYTNCVKMIEFNGYILNSENENETDWEAEDFTDRVRRIITVCTKKDDFCCLNLSDEKLYEVVQALNISYIKNMMDGTQSI